MILDRIYLAESDLVSRDMHTQLRRLIKRSPFVQSFLLFLGRREKIRKDDNMAFKNDS